MLANTRSQTRAGPSLTRRSLLFGTPFALSGCVQSLRQSEPQAVGSPRVDQVYVAMYSAIHGEPFPIPAIDVSAVEPRNLRQYVRSRTSEQPGTIVVNPDTKLLYLVMTDGYAMRYGIGVGREGFGWSGAAIIRRPKREGEPCLTPYHSTEAICILSRPSRAGEITGESNERLGPRAS